VSAHALLAHIFTFHVLHAPSQKRPHRRPAPSRPSPVELSSECRRSHSPPPARTAASKTSLTPRARRVHRPARPLTLHRPHTVDSNGRQCPALAPARCTSAI